MCNAPVYVINNAIAAASQAGFKGPALTTIVAIAMAESCLDTAAQHVNTDGSVDRGILQINNKYHPEVSDSCAYDIQCAFNAAYRISNQGTDFSAWATYTSGAYKENIPAVQALTNFPGYQPPGTVNTSGNPPAAGGATMNAATLAKGAIGFLMMLVGLALLIKALTPQGVQQAVKEAVLA